MTTNEALYNGRVRFDPQTSTWVGAKKDGTLVEHKDRKVLIGMLQISDSLEESKRKADIVPVTWNKLPQLYLLMIAVVIGISFFGMGFVTGYFLK